MVMPAMPAPITQTSASAAGAVGTISAYGSCQTGTDSWWARSILHLATTFPGQCARCPKNSARSIGGGRVLRTLREAADAIGSPRDPRGQLKRRVTARYA